MSRTLFRTRIKFCGLTRVGDVRLAGELGADAIRLVFAADSPGGLHPEKAGARPMALAPMVDSVAVFRDNASDEVREVVKQVRPSLLQFHGAEDDAFCRSFGVPYVKAIAMGNPLVENAMALQARYPHAIAFLFDSHGDDASGGSGRSFHWSRMPQGLNKPTMEAGGLSPANTFHAIVTTIPWGVDASSGIESAPGIKDGDRMRAFVEEVRRADCHIDPDIDADSLQGVAPRTATRG